MKRTCPCCGGKVPLSLGSKPKTFCSLRCQRRQSDRRRAVRAELAERLEQRELVATGRLVVSNGWGPVSVEWIGRRIAELEAELARLGA